LNRKTLFAVVGCLALLALALSALASATSPTSHAATTDVPADNDAVQSGEQDANDFEDGGVDSSHEFEGEEEGEF
jgi:hypothetical protein